MYDTLISGQYLYLYEAFINADKLKMWEIGVLIQKWNNDEVIEIASNIRKYE